MQIDHGVAGVGVAQQGLNDGQLGAAVQQMGGEAVAERMGVDTLGDAGAPGGLAAGVPDDFVGDRLIGAARLQTGEQPAGLCGAASGSRSAVGRAVWG